MRLPNGERAVVELSKLADYCLSPTHPTGKHKARVFRAALGMTARHAPWLRQALLAAAKAEEALLTARDRYGERYVIDFFCSVPAASAAVRSHWIVRAGEDFPRLVTCYVLPKEGRP